MVRDGRYERQAVVALETSGLRNARSIRAKSADHENRRSWVLRALERVRWKLPLSKAFKDQDSGAPAIGGKEHQRARTLAGSIESCRETAVAFDEP